MALHTNEHVKKTLTAALESGETLEQFCYALKSFKGYCIGLTPQRLILIRLSLFLGRPKETVSIPRADIADAHYDESELSFKTKNGAAYKFLMQGTAGLDGDKNFVNARNLYQALVR